MLVLFSAHDSSHLISIFSADFPVTLYNPHSFCFLTSLTSWSLRNFSSGRKVYNTCSPGVTLSIDNENIPLSSPFKFYSYGGGGPPLTAITPLASRLSG